MRIIVAEGVDIDPVTQLDVRSGTKISIKEKDLPWGFKDIDTNYMKKLFFDTLSEARITFDKVDIYICEDDDDADAEFITNQDEDYE